MEIESEKTQPPISPLRYNSPGELFTSMPKIREFTRHKPRDDEGYIEYLNRLKSSTTPEEVLTLTAFAASPKMAVWWGYECLRMMPEYLSDSDRELLKLVADWTAYPDAENRYRAMKVALWAPKLSPVVFLALGVGWSGGQFAPNDPASPPPWRTPRAINSAVLSCLAQADLSRRTTYLAQFIKMTDTLFRIF